MLGFDPSTSWIYKPRNFEVLNKKEVENNLESKVK
jgi:hypothetical protein